MDSVIKDALKLKRSALKTLAEKNANRVYSVSYILLGDINLAKKATAFVFKDIEGLLVGEKIETEKDFSEACTKKAVDYCKTITLKKDAKAYRIPENRDFSLSPSAECDGVGNCYEYVFGKFSPLQKLIFVSFSVLEQGEKETARVTKLDKKTLSLALDAEGQNAIRLLASIGRSEDASYQGFIDYYKEIEMMPIPDASVMVDISEIIDKTVSPVEKKARRKLAISAAIAVATAIIIGFSFFVIVKSINSVVSTDTESSDTVSETETVVQTEPVIELDADKTYYADIDIKDYGTITVKLDQNSAPITTANFINLAENGFYDGLTFHRIIEGFMMQGGDPQADGTGGSDECIYGEFEENGFENNLSHTRGAIAMARNSSDCNSASSQFFIMHETDTSLDGSYAVFGYVTEGIEIVDSICENANPTDSNGTISLVEQPLINSITIREE